MVTPRVTAKRSSTSIRILARLAGSQTGSVVLVDAGERPVEICTLSDVMWLLERRADQKHLDWLLTERFDRPDGWVLESVTPDMPLTKALWHMERTHVHRMPAIDDHGKLVGILRLWYLLAASAGVRRPDAAPT